MKSKKTTTQKNHKNQLHELAKGCQENAHSPYSQHKIGAALITNKGKISYGCNVENASYGATVCAERVAIWSMIAEHGPQKIKEICVVSDAKKPWPPCGMCLQVIAEFADVHTVIHLASTQKIHHSYKLKDLLPEAFHAHFL